MLKTHAVRLFTHGWSENRRVDVFLRVIALNKMQTDLMRDWTRMATAISCDGNHYTTNSAISYLYKNEYVA